MKVQITWGIRFGGSFCWVLGVRFGLMHWCFLSAQNTAWAIVCVQVFVEEMNEWTKLNESCTSFFIIVINYPRSHLESEFALHPSLRKCLVFHGREDAAAQHQVACCR